MSLTSIQQSNHLMIIRLKSARLEDIFQKKLLYILDQTPPQSYLFDEFCRPLEKALIERVLEFFKGNQLKTARALGINRNTLKKKMKSHKLNLKTLLMNPPSFRFLEEEVFATSLKHLPLFELSRHKIKSLKAEKEFSKQNLLKEVCNPIQKKIILTCLEFFKGNQLKTARALGINRNTLKKKLNQFKREEK